jgi:nitrite reductase/ring-hydroxylating ferredoxin subunit/DMSO/TMAO reductase YedYZ heme-binding membrane subunit
VSVQYQAVGWNPQKRLYDTVVASGVVLYLGLFVGVGAWIFPYVTPETLLIRGLGTVALLLLHIILCIGPLCRLQPRFLPLLYNRRHLGVTMFLLALSHGTFSIIQFHSLGVVNPLVSLLTTNRNWGSLPDFPFQQLGFAALLILFLMAATSHDFWLRNLTPPVWKSLHMLVYAAYGLLVAHVVLGTLQSETSLVFAVVLGAGFATVVTLHLLAAFKERRIDQRIREAAKDGFVNACTVESIPENRAAIVSVEGERIAIFRYDGKISALSNVCRHQNGPLGEGKIIDGCVTCPWHGYQYRPESGSAPPPFTEKVSTFSARVVDGQVWVCPKANPPGTQVEPCQTSPAVAVQS